jgi:hypothetical protein
LLDAIGEPRDLTLIRAPGQPTDDPALAHVRELFADQIYREVAFERVCEVAGDTVVLDSGPGFTRADSQLMSRALAVAELRFERVIVLPTAVDLSCDDVREALARSRATFVAPQIEAEHDSHGSESPRLGPSDLPAARVTAVILTCAQPDSALRAADSVLAADVDSAVLVLDNNSRDADTHRLVTGVGNRERVWLHRSDRNLRTGGGRSFGVTHSSSDYILFLDDDAVLAPGALEALVAELDEHPDAAAVSATVVGADGRVQHSGGWVEVAGGIAEFSVIGAGCRPGELPPSGPSGWVPGTAMLARRELFAQFPIDPDVAAYYEDNEWSYRIALDRPGCFRRSWEAIVIHDRLMPPPPPQDFEMRSRAVGLLAAHAAFYRRHGVLLGPALFDLVHQLRDADGEPDVDGARVLLELVTARGPDWVFMEWMNGGLRDLLHGRHDRLALKHENVELHEQNEQLRAQVRAQRAWIDEHTELLSYLRRRDETLQRVERGGWWQLRQRALPALRVVWRLQRRGPTR